MEFFSFMNNYMELLINRTKETGSYLQCTKEDRRQVDQQVKW